MNEWHKKKKRKSTLYTLWEKNGINYSSDPSLYALNTSLTSTDMSLTEKTLKGRVTQLTNLILLMVSGTQRRLFECSLNEILKSLKLRFWFLTFYLIL
jgi:hypothetical protein